jgi:hypothetical protein
MHLTVMTLVIMFINRHLLAKKLIQTEKDHR